MLLAAKRGHAETVKLLLQSRCSVNASNTNSESPLFGAAFHNHPETVQVLLEGRADLQQRAEVEDMPTVLHAAAKRDNLEVAQLLLIARADHTCLSPDGSTPLDLAKSDEMRQILGGGQKRARSENA